MKAFNVQHPLQAKPGDVASVMANAPLTGSVPVEKPNTDAGKVHLPKPMFTLVANPKSYEDRNDKSKSNTRIAYVALTSGPFTFQASIYLEVKITQREDGRHEEKAIRFSMPKGVSLLDSLDSAKVDAWKDSVIDGYLAWRKESGGTIASRGGAGVRTI
jgi:hypothetical protein